MNDTSKNLQPSKAKKLAKGAIDLQFAGDLILVKCLFPEYGHLVRKYEALFESFANMDRDERFLNYKLLNALMLTSHAKKTSDIAEKKELFSKKNELYIDITKIPAQRKKVAFRYLVSKNFRVVEYCKSCIEKNESLDKKLKRHQWKFCNNCKIDKDFFNVLSMYHKFDDGSAGIFLSNDLLSQLPIKNFKLKGKLEKHKEEMRFKRYLYSIKDLDVFCLESVKKMHAKVIGK
ncbi:MAG: hypothetical protein R3B45_01935 [Bdellovibrionota bacterium]